MYLPGVCVSQPPALCLTPGPGPQFVFTGPGPKFVFTGPGRQFVFTGPGTHPVFTNPDTKFVFTGPVYPKFVFTVSARSLSLHIPTLSPQFLFTGTGLRFVRTQAAKLIYPQ